MLTHPHHLGGHHILQVILKNLIQADPVQHFTQPCSRHWMFDPKQFVWCLQFLSVKGLAESPPPTVAVEATPKGLALLSATVSNGITNVTILSQ